MDGKIRLFATVVLLITIIFSFPNHVQAKTYEENIIIDGYGEDWEGIEPIINDTYIEINDDPADIKSVKAFTHKGYLYLMIETVKKVGYREDIDYYFHIDTNNDFKEDYQGGLRKDTHPRVGGGRVWLWNLTGMGSVVDWSKLKWLRDYFARVADVNLNDVVELKMPLFVIGDNTEFNLRVSTKKNPYTNWGRVSSSGVKSEFLTFKTTQANIYYQDSINIDRVREVGNAFEQSLTKLDEDFGVVPLSTFKLYVFETQADLVNGLISIGGFSYQEASFFKNSGAPRPIDYIMYVSPYFGWHDIAHEYTHTIIEEMAGKNSQVNFKWFDEGLAEYEAIRIDYIKSEEYAKNKRSEKYRIVTNAYNRGELLSFGGITKEEDWVKNMREGRADLEYAQAYVAMDYLDDTVKFKELLLEINSGLSFDDAFSKTFGLTVKQFEANFKDYVKMKAYEREEEERKEREITGITIDGKAEDWIKYDSIIQDDFDASKEDPADIEYVKAFTYGDYLYIMFKTTGIASSGDVHYAFHVDLNGDKKPEYQPGFSKDRGWIWNLRGAGYSDSSNVRSLGDVSIGIGNVAEFRMPLSELDNANEFKIRAYTFEEGKLANSRTKYGKVISHEIKPKIVILANSIDYELASEFFGFLENKGVETIHATASDFEQYTEEKFIVILGGPDAPEGVGEIVQQTLTNDEQNYLRQKGNRMKFTKTNVWTTGQRVTILAGSDRQQTQNAHIENREGVATEASS